MMRYLAGGLGLVAVGLLIALRVQSGAMDRLRDTNARLERNAVVLTRQIENARLAAEVSAAYAAREREMASKATATIEAIRNLELGECADAPLDSDLRRVLDGL